MLWLKSELPRLPRGMNHQLDTSTDLKKTAIDKDLPAITDIQDI